MHYFCTCQGVEAAATYKNLGLSPQWYGALEWVFPNWARTHALDTGEAVNVLKGAIVTADRILTVSQVRSIDNSSFHLRSIRTISFASVLKFILLSCL